MSYDLDVYTAKTLSLESIRQLVVDARLVVDDDSSAGEALHIVRGAKRRYSFTLEEALRVEAEDIPDEVTARALDSSYLYQVLVEGSLASEIPYAVRFARRIAAAADGVVLDGQTGLTWSRGKMRSAPPVDAGEVSIVWVNWYVNAENDPCAAAEQWLTLARRHLPEAIPRRFGAFEPLQHRLEPGQDQAFIDFVGSDDGIHFTTGRPTVSGHLAGETRHWGPIAAHGLTILHEPLQDPRWRDALRRMFVDFAQSTSAVLATAEVLRKWTWSGGTLGHKVGYSEQGAYLAARGHWKGLPPHPVWWTWFGADYVPLVRDRLPASQVRSHGDALLFQRSDAPADRDQLHAADERAGTSNSIPAELRATVDRSDPHVLNPPLLPAAVRPSGLT